MITKDRQKKKPWFPRNSLGSRSFGSPLESSNKIAAICSATSFTTRLTRHFNVSQTLVCIIWSFSSTLISSTSWMVIRTMMGCWLSLRTGRISELYPLNTSIISRSSSSLAKTWDKTGGRERWRGQTAWKIAHFGEEAAKCWWAGMLLKTSDNSGQLKRVWSARGSALGVAKMVSSDREMASVGSAGGAGCWVWVDNAGSYVISFCPERRRRWSMADRAAAATVRLSINWGRADKWQWQPTCGLPSSLLPSSLSRLIPSGRWQMDFRKMGGVGAGRMQRTAGRPPACLLFSHKNKLWKSLIAKSHQASQSYFVREICNGLPASQLWTNFFTTHFIAIKMITFGFFMDIGE